MKLISMAYTLFLLMDPLGNIPLFVSLLKDISGKRQRRIIFRELLIALGVMILFSFIGDALLTSLNVAPYTVSISGGLILFLLSLKMIFPSQKDADSVSGEDKEPFIVPLAIPMVAGPAVLAAIMLLARQEESITITVGAICLAWAFTTLILLSSSYLKKILGWRGIVACERLMGLLLTMLSIQMFLEGITQYIAALK
jgi:multiple antibiotic resistance protein